MPDIGTYFGKKAQNAQSGENYLINLPNISGDDNVSERSAVTHYLFHKADRAGLLNTT